MKFLIIRFSSIGDIVLTTPLIRCLKEQLPKVEIHYLTKKEYAPIVNSNPYIDKVHSLRNSLAEVNKDLKKENFDHIIDLHKNIRSLRVKNSLGKPVTTFDKINMEKFLMVSLKIDKLPDIHIVDRYMKAVRSFGVKNDGKGLDFFIPEEEGYDPELLPEKFRKNYLAWVIGAKHNTKKFPSTKVIQICNETDRHVVLIGGPEDSEMGQEIKKETGTNVLDLTGKTSLFGSAAILRDAEKVITNDTGMMHIAAAMGKEIISLWGNTIPEFGMYPYYGSDKIPENMLEVRDLNCRPCSKIGFIKCPEGHFRCMREISNEHILELINREVHAG